MKKIFTLAATAALSTAAMTAQAQITVDGQVLAGEGYQELGSYTGTRGFGNYGLAKLLVRTTPTKLYIAVVGVVENNGNSLQVYMNHPRKTGVAAGTALPKSNITGTSFEQNSAKMEMEVDYAFGVKGGAANSASSIIDYTRLNGTGATATATDQVTGDLPIAGTVVTVPTTITGGLNKTRMAFKNVASLAAHTGVEAWEIELDRADLDIQNNDQLQFFAAQNNNNGSFYSTDVIPAVTGRTTNLERDPDFTALPGTQFVNYNAVVASSRKEVANAFKFSAYPNPAAGSFRIGYTVPGAPQDLAVDVYSTVGQRVRAVAAGRQVGTQQHEVTGLAAGTYLVHLRVGDQRTTQLVVVE